MEILLAVVVAALLALTGSIVMVGRVALRPIEPRPPDPEPMWNADQVAELARQAAENSGRIDALTTAVSEGIAGYKRHETRVQKTIASARRLVAENGLEHAALEAEVEELSDGDDREPEPEPQIELLRAEPEVRRTGMPGVSPEELERIRGII